MSMSQKLSCMLFSQESPVVVAGSSAGGVAVLRLIDGLAEEQEPEEHRKAGQRYDVRSPAAIWQIEHIF